jgi:hypothetical protein
VITGLRRLQSSSIHTQQDAHIETIDPRLRLSPGAHGKRERESVCVCDGGTAEVGSTAFSTSGGAAHRKKQAKGLGSAPDLGWGRLQTPETHIARSQASLGKTDTVEHKLSS